jgi:hypothetical protein
MTPVSISAASAEAQAIPLRRSAFVLVLRIFVTPLREARRCRRIERSMPAAFEARRFGRRASAPTPSANRREASGARAMGDNRTLLN